MPLEKVQTLNPSYQIKQEIHTVSEAEDYFITWPECQIPFELLENMKKRKDYQKYKNMLKGIY
jgi:hypothetical protein